MMLRYLVGITVSLVCKEFCECESKEEAAENIYSHHGEIILHAGKLESLA